MGLFLHPDYEPRSKKSIFGGLALASSYSACGATMRQHQIFNLFYILFLTISQPFVVQ